MPVLPPLADAHDFDGFRLEFIISASSDLDLIILFSNSSVQLRTTDYYI